MIFYFEALSTDPKTEVVTVQILTGPRGNDNDIVRKVGCLRFAPEEWMALQESPGPDHFCVRNKPQYQ